MNAIQFFSGLLTQFVSAWLAVFPSDGLFILSLTLDSPDVEMQHLAGQWALRYNESSPPPPIPLEFVTSYVLELVDRPGRPICGVERRIDGSFQKVNIVLSVIIMSHQAYRGIKVDSFAIFLPTSFPRIPAQ
jgi:hypothetical protein